MKKPQHGVAIESWSYTKKVEVITWLNKHFGFGGVGGPNCDKRWGTEYDYGQDNLYMDEDVYILYLLRWV